MLVAQPQESGVKQSLQTFRVALKLRRDVDTAKMEGRALPLLNGIKHDHNYLNHESMVCDESLVVVRRIGCNYITCNLVLLMFDK